MNEPHRYSDWDAAYVLGALSVPQRHAYEDHLGSCPDCRAAVSELAAMPGLLGQLTAEEARALNSDVRLDDHPGEAVAAEAGADRRSAELPDSIRTMAPPRRSARGRLIVVALVVLALIIGGVTGYLARGAVGPSPGAQPSATAPSTIRVAFSPVGASTMIAVADLTNAGSRTVIDVECQYPPSSRYPGGGGGTGPTTVRYALYLVDSYGNRTRGPTWSAAPGQRVMQQMRADLPRTKISALEIVYATSGDVAVRAKL